MVWLRTCGRVVDGHAEPGMGPTVVFGPSCSWFDLGKRVLYLGRHGAAQQAAKRPGFKLHKQRGEGLHSVLEARGLTKLMQLGASVTNQPSPTITHQPPRPPAAGRHRGSQASQLALDRSTRRACSVHELSTRAPVTIPPRKSRLTMDDGQQLKDGRMQWMGLLGIGIPQTHKCPTRPPLPLFSPFLRGMVPRPGLPRFDFHPHPIIPRPQGFHHCTLVPSSLSHSPHLFLSHNTDLHKVGR